MTPWSKICVSQADCVLLVAAPGASPQVAAAMHTESSPAPALHACSVGHARTMRLSQGAMQF